MEIYNVMKHYIFQNDRTSHIALQAHNSTTAIVSCCCTPLHSYRIQQQETIAVVERFTFFGGIVGL